MNQNKSRYPKERKDLSEEEINKLIELYFNNENKLQSLFSNRIYSSLRSWKDSFSRNGISKSSIKKILYAIAKQENNFSCCVYCNNKLKIEDFDTISMSFKKHCIECAKNYAFAQSQNLSEETLKSRGIKITNAKLKFFETDRGKLVAKSVGLLNKLHLTGTFLSEERKQKQSNTMKQKIANGDFSPGVNNNFTNWEARFEETEIVFKFRSSWELCFFYCNKTLEYEKIKIPYLDEREIKKTYIADFYDRNKNIIYEIKPKGFWIKQCHKMNSVIEYCLKNNITFIWINEFNIMNYIDIEFIKQSNNPEVLKNLNKLLEGISYNEIAKTEN